MIFNLKKNWDKIHKRKLFNLNSEREALKREINRLHNYLHKTEINDFKTYKIYNEKLKHLDKLYGYKTKLENQLITADDKGAFKT